MIQFRRYHAQVLSKGLTLLRQAALVAMGSLVMSQTLAQTAEGSAQAKLSQEVTADTPRLLKTLETLTAIESGSLDLEGLARVAQVIAERLKAAGMSIEMIPAKAPADHVLLKGATLGSMVYGRLKGKGSKKVLLIAHMDTVYTKGMGAKQPFRIDGNRAYGLGIADDKQGIALIIHTMAILRSMNFHDYG